MNSVIELRQAGMRFGEVRAVEDVDLSVAQGEVFGLIGHNGAGKTTLFKLMLGLLAPTSGEVRVCGEPVRGEAFRQVRRRIGYLPENISLYENLTGLETLEFFAGLKAIDPQTCPALLGQVGLADAGLVKVSAYSKGMRQRLAFAQALLGKPQLLFLDEPTNGLDPQGIRDFYEVLRSLSEDGVTTILSSHQMAEIQQRVSRLALMKQGKIASLGTVRNLRERSALPLRIEVELRNGAEPELRRILPEGGQIIRVNGSTAHLQCLRSDKLRLLASLSALGDHLVDIHISEPSLEDLFLGNAEFAS
ncbi:ABC transporter ATP-binding protein [Ramlibacter solisilvae]|uniref:Copper ABC transporter ATP-binding protein n=1 Tax=Ramlibacter tataouinensis TaxID=94132 RepID=A0A127JQH8_9BURK|nr:ABC transporter ATP-binding protein [Ramlibacter tataouinensis]AMO22288.1 copper ABC transporter ATP-binding protein [Ramlibacter tataouinensis]